MNYKVNLETVSKVALTTCLVVASMSLAYAVTTSGSSESISSGDAFKSVWETVKAWTEGTLGKVMALAMVLVGVAAGIVRQSLMGLVVGIGGGVGLYNAPKVIDSIMGVTATSTQQLVDLTHYAFWSLPY